MKFFTKFYLAVSGALAMLAMTTPAMAATTITSSEIGVVAPGETVVFDADGVGAGLLTGDFITFNSTQGNAAALPGNTTNQIAVLGGQMAFLRLGQLANSLAFEWGSIDAYNTWQVITSDGPFTFSGSLFPPANGDRSSAATNRRVNLAFNSPTFVEGIRFSSGSNSFEFDNVAISSAVPEPATWMMLILGFGLIGSTMRRRSKLGLGRISFA